MEIKYTDMNNSPRWATELTTISIATSQPACGNANDSHKKYMQNFTLTNEMFWKVMKFGLVVAVHWGMVMVMGWGEGWWADVAEEDSFQYQYTLTFWVK